VATFLSIAHKREGTLEEAHVESDRSRIVLSVVVCFNCWCLCLCSTANDSQAEVSRMRRAKSTRVSPALRRHRTERPSPATSFNFSRTQNMENPPLASLSLTHVHYVSYTLISQHALLTLLEPRRPHLVPMRMACPRPPSAMRHLRDADMVEPRD
jgi:hypothetical protein